MICLSIALTRLPHLTREAFLAYWRDQHAPLVTALATDLGIRRYVQLHGLVEADLDAATPAPPAGAAYDGVAEVWFDDLASAASSGATAGGRAAIKALREDEARFILRERTLSWWSRPHIVIG